MRYHSKGAVLLLCAGTALSALALVPDSNPNRFQPIPERNVFGLKSPQTPAPTNPPAQTPKLILTGITTILGNKRALLKEQPPGGPGKPGDALKEVSYILTEGQRDGDVEVLQIDERAGSVRVNLGGTTLTLTFEKDGAKLPSTPPPGAAGALPGNGTLPPGAVAAGMPTPGTLPPVPGAVDTNTSANRGFPSRTPRWPMTGTANNTGASQLPPPTGRLPTAAAPNGTTASETDLQGLTLEEQRSVQQ